MSISPTGITVVIEDLELKPPYTELIQIISSIPDISYNVSASSVKLRLTLTDYKFYSSYEILCNDQSSIRIIPIVKYEPKSISRIIYHITSSIKKIQ